MYSPRMGIVFIHVCAHISVYRVGTRNYPGTYLILSSGMHVSNIDLGTLLTYKNHSLLNIYFVPRWLFPKVLRDKIATS